MVTSTPSCTHCWCQSTLVMGVDHYVCCKCGDRTAKTTVLPITLPYYPPIVPYYPPGIPYTPWYPSTPAITWINTAGTNTALASEIA